MKSKKLLSTILALLLVLTSIPVFMLPVSAEGYEAYIGTTGYATFEDAVTAANAATEDVTITLAANVTLEANQTIKNTSGKNVTIDGGDLYTITADGSTTYCLVFATSGAIKDVEINCNRGPDLQAASLTLDGVTINADDDAGVKVSSPVDSSTQQKLTVQNSTINAVNTTDTTTSCPCITLYNNKPTVVDVIDSTLVYNGGSTSQNNCSVILRSTGGASSTEINLKGTTTLSFTPLAAPSSIVGALRVNSSCSATFNIEAGVTITTNNEVSSAANNGFVSNSGTCTINDNGAKWVASADALKKGLILPVQSGVYDQYTYTIGTTAYTVDAGATAQSDNATEAVTFKHATSGNSLWEVSGTGYPTWDAAYDAVSDGGTMTLLKDISAWTNVEVIEKNITIDGGGYSLASTASYIWEFKAGGAVQNFKKITSAQGVKFHANANKDLEFTIQNIEEWAASKVVANAVSASGENTYKQTLNIKNVTINSTANEPAVMTYNYCPGKIVIDNSTINYKGTAATTNPNYPHMSAIRVRYNTATEIELKNGTEINYAPTTTNTGATFNVINVQESANVAVRLDDTVKVTLSDANNGSGTVATAYFISGKAVTVDDAGAEWTTTVADTKFAQATPNGTVALINTTSKALAAPTAALAAATYKTLGLTNVAGASVRTAGPIGIRFAANSNAVFNDSTLFEGATVTFGHIITTKEILATVNGDFSQLTDANAVKSVVTKWVDDAKTNYRSALVDIPQTAAAMQKNFAATAYVTITIGGNSVTYYAAYNETDNCRSIYDVAKAAVATDEYKDNATLKAIVNLVEASTQALSFTDKTADGVYAISDTTEQIVYTGFTASDLLAYENNVKKNLI